MSNKIKFILKNAIAIVFVTVVVCQIAFASYSAQGTFKLIGKNEPWTSTTTSGTRLTQRKKTDEGIYLVKATSKSMKTSPKFCLIGTDNVIYSKIIDIHKVDKEYKSTNTAQAYWYMSACLKASRFQYGTDTISVKFDPK